MQQNLTAFLLKLKTHMQGMVKDAQSHNWQNVYQSDLVRQQLLKRFSFEGIRLSNDERKLRESILQLDQELLERVALNRDLAAKELDEFKKQKSGCNKYSQTQQTLV